MDYGFWYDVSQYANDNWKGCFTPKEIAEGAYEYLCEWEGTLKDGKVTSVLDTLMHQLHEDYCNGSNEAVEILNTIVDELVYKGIKWAID